MERLGNVFPGSRVAFGNHISPGLEAGVKQAENWKLIKELLILPFVLQISIKGFNMTVKL